MPRSVAIEPEVGERLTRGEPELRLDEVDACHLLGDRVLDLEACVRLDEPVHVALDEELDRRHVLQARFEREPHRASTRCSRTTGSRCGAGAISMIFWWRRWMLQSRSPKSMTRPVWSPSTCTSMWRTP